MVSKKPEEIWITNFSRVQDIRVGDLILTVHRVQSINLLSRKKNGKSKFPFTREMIDKSIESGSIFEKRNVIKVRRVAPIVFNHRIDLEKTPDRSSTRLNRKQTDIEIPDFPDLDVDDDRSLEEYAAETADMEFADHQPILAVDPKFRKPTVDNE